MPFANCKRIPPQANIGFVAESATLLFFYALLCCFGFLGQIAKTVYCAKALQKQVTEPATKCVEFGTSLWNS